MAIKKGAPWTCSALLSFIGCSSPALRLTSHENSRWGTEASTVTRDKSKLSGPTSHDDMLHKLVVSLVTDSRA
jgi:hypothetical protein